MPIEYGSHRDMIRAPLFGGKPYIMIFLHIYCYSIILLLSLFLILYLTNRFNFFFDLLYLITVNHFPKQWFHRSQQSSLSEPSIEDTVNSPENDLYSAPSIPFSSLYSVFCVVFSLIRVNVLNYILECLSNTFLYLFNVRVEISTKYNWQLTVLPKLLSLQMFQLLMSNGLILVRGTSIQMDIYVHEMLPLIFHVFEVLDNSELDHFACFLRKEQSLHIVSMQSLYVENSGSLKLLATLHHWCNVYLILVISFLIQLFQKYGDCFQIERADFLNV